MCVLHGTAYFSHRDLVWPRAHYITQPSPHLKGQICTIRRIIKRIALKVCGNSRYFHHQTFQNFPCWFGMEVEDHCSTMAIFSKELEHSLINWSSAVILLALWSRVGEQLIHHMKDQSEERDRQRLSLCRCPYMLIRRRIAFRKIQQLIIQILMLSVAGLRTVTTNMKS